MTVLGLRELDRNLNRLARKYPRDTARALNKTATRAATRTRRGLSAAVNVPQKLLRRRVQGFKTSYRELNASVWVGARAHIKLGQVPGARVSLSTGVLKAGRLRVQTFKARMPSGHRGLFVRKPGSEHKERPDGQWTELPIEEPRVRLAEPAKPILLAASVEQMTSFFPGELRRLIARTNQRLAKRGR